MPEKILGIYTICGKTGEMKRKNGKTDKKMGNSFPGDDRNDKKWAVFFSVWDC